MKIIFFTCTMISGLMLTACGGNSYDTTGRVEPTIITLPLSEQHKSISTAAADSAKSGVGIVITQDNQVAVLKDDGTWENYPIDKTMSSLEKWESLDVPPDILNFFRQLFETVGVRVIDTGEQFTCILMEKHAEFIDSIDEINVDFVIEIYSYQVDRLAKYISRGELDDVERFRILKVLVKSDIKGKNHPLKNPLMSSTIFRWLIGGKKILHINLISPNVEAERDGHYTFLHANEWVVLEGLHGTPQRVLNVTLDDALELQVKFYESMKADSWRQWYKTARWYKGWREKVSQPISER